MATTTPAFSTYTYRVGYKLDASGVENVLSPGVSLVSSSISAYNYFTEVIKTSITPINNVILLVTRNKITAIDSVTSEVVTLAEEKVVYNSSFDFLNYDTRQAILVSDNPIEATSTTYTILFQLLNVNTTEKIPCKYKLPNVIFSSTPTVEQHLDLYYKKDSDTGWTSLGTNIVVPVTGELNNIDLGELEEDTKYDVKMYHYEQSKILTASFYSNIVPTIGNNPILGKVEWNGRVISLDAPNVRSRMYPSSSLVDWMFCMDYSTKSFANINSSLYSSITDNYNFKMVTSSDKSDEVYIGSEITNTHYLGLPIDYTDSHAADNGASQNIYYSTLFGTASLDTTRRTIFCKFYIEDNHIGPVKLINFYNGTTEHYIGLNVTSGNIVTFEAFGTSYSLPSGTSILKNKWYTLILVCKNNTILYTNISDYSNYSNNTVPVNSGATIGNVNSKVGLIAANRVDITLEIDYSASTTDAGNMGLCINYVTYQYQDNTPENQPIVSSHTAYIPITNGTNKTATYTITNDAAYGVAVGYSLKFLSSGVTANGSVTINDLKVNSTSVLSQVTSIGMVIDSSCSAYMGGTATTITFTKTGDTISYPIGGILFSNIVLTSSIAASQQVFIGGGIVNSTANYVVSKFGFRVSTVSSDSWNTPFNYIDFSIVDNLSTSYKYMPYLNCICNGVTTKVPTTNMTEMKDATVRFLLSGLTIGDNTINLISNTDILNSTTRKIKAIKMSVADATYDIDFENDFDNAIVEFKKRYYAKQKRWGGNMGGGTHAALIYFNRGEKILILEQHGDNYSGVVPSIAPAGSEGYGLPVDITETPTSFTDQTHQRVKRVGGLIQSVDYHGYGMFDCWFSVPKGMLGLAICLWYFHYQEIYSYDSTFNFWTQTGVKGYKYDQCVKTGYGATWVVINNEIDMELGSENTPYRVTVDPNIDESISWYVPGLSKRQAIGCTQTGSNYGTWIIDWNASLPVINAVVEINPQNANSYLLSNKLTWIHITNTIDEVNTGASTRSCRFNNWMAEQWNDGCGIYGTVANSYLGKDELAVCNRTVLGTLNLSASELASRYIAHYYDDGLYHKWSIDWTSNYTRLLIDDEEISVNKCFVPFNPMTMLIGCWFPSCNVYDQAALNNNFGTWSGLNANWDVNLMKVRRIKFTPYTETEAPTTDMRYDCETYAEDGLKEIL